MAKSHEIPAPDPVNESETEESETELSDSEPEPEQVRKAPAAKLQKSDSSSLSEESGSESDSDSKLDSPPTTVKQLPSSSAAAKKAPALASPTTRFTTETKKRSSTLSLTQERSKKTKSAATEGKKLFERVFAQEDEIIVLEELLKRYPFPQMDDLYESVRSKISVPVTKAQVVAKIKRLRTKFFNKKSTSRNVEEDEHEMMVNQLSQKIWGKEEEGPKSVVKTTNIALRFEETMAKDEKAMGKDEKEKDVSYAPKGVWGSVDEWVFGEGTGLLPEEARSELEIKWKSIRREEARLAVEKHELSLQQAKIVYEAMSP